MRLRYPLTAPIVLRLVNQIMLDEERINLKAAFYMTFPAFLRSGEFT